MYLMSFLSHKFKGAFFLELYVYLWNWRRSKGKERTPKKMAAVRLRLTRFGSSIVSRLQFGKLSTVKNFSALEELEGTKVG